MGGQAIHATATSWCGPHGSGGPGRAWAPRPRWPRPPTAAVQPICMWLRVDRQASLLKLWTTAGAETTTATQLACRGLRSGTPTSASGADNENTLYANFDFYSGAIFRTAISDADRTLITGMFAQRQRLYDDGDYWTVTTPGIFDGTFYMPGDQVLGDRHHGMDFAEVDWARIPAPTLAGEVIPAIPGYVDFPATVTNYMTIPNTTMGTDASFDVRVECERPPNPATGEYRVSDSPFYIGFSPTTPRPGAFVATDATFPATATPAVYGTLEAAGFPQVGQWVQMRLVWTAATDVQTLYWRTAVRDLADDTGWIQMATATNTGKALRTSDATWALGGTAATTAMRGKVRRWRALVNAVLWRDINATTNFTDGSVTSFTATTGQTVTVLRTGSPSTKLVPTVPEHFAGTAAPPINPTYFGLVEMNGPPSDLEVSFFEDAVTYPVPTARYPQLLTTACGSRMPRW